MRQGSLTSPIPGLSLPLKNGDDVFEKKSSIWRTYNELFDHNFRAIAHLIQVGLVLRSEVRFLRDISAATALDVTV